MGKIWWSEMELFQRLLQLRQTDAQIVEHEREAYQAEADKLRRQVEEMQAAATPPPPPHPPTHPCQKPWVTPDAHARCAATDAGQARCAWATVGGRRWDRESSPHDGCFSAFRSHMACVLEKASFSYTTSSRVISSRFLVGVLATQSLFRAVQVSVFTPQLSFFIEPLLTYVPHAMAGFTRPNPATCCNRQILVCTALI